MAPLANEHVERNQGDFEHQEEQEKVERKERTHAARHEQREPCVVTLRAVFWLRCEKRDREQDASEHNEEQRDAIDAKEELDVERLHPGLLNHELESGVAGLELNQQRNTQNAS